MSHDTPPYLRGARYTGNAGPNMNELQERYSKMSKTAWFKAAHDGRSLLSAYDPEHDVVGDASGWSNRRVVWGLAWLAVFAVMFWLGSVAFPFGEWR